MTRPTRMGGTLLCVADRHGRDPVPQHRRQGRSVNNVTGLEALHAKSKWWADNHVLHKVEVSGPYPHDDRFAVRFLFDMTDKPSGKRLTMDEIGLFSVKNDKITREEFFYTGG